MQLLCLFGLSQQDNKFVIHGTKVIAAKGKDGIIIAADSRVSIDTILPNGKSDHLGYFDNYQKIFPAGKFVVSASGHTYVNGVSIKQVIVELLSKKPTFTDPESFIKLLSNEIHARDSTFFYDGVGGIIICCGYYNGYPQISAYDRGGLYQVVHYKTTWAYDRSFTDKYNPQLSCNEIKDLAITSLEDYAKNHPEEKYGIGGNTTVLQIRPNSTLTWLTDTSKLVYWKTIKDLVKACLNGEVNIITETPEALKAIRNQFQFWIDKKIIK